MLASPKYGDAPASSSPTYKIAQAPAHLPLFFFDSCSLDSIDFLSSIPMASFGCNLLPLCQVLLVASPQHPFYLFTHSLPVLCLYLHLETSALLYGYLPLIPPDIVHHLQELPLLLISKDLIQGSIFTQLQLLPVAGLQLSFLCDSIVCLCWCLYITHLMNLPMALVAITACLL